MTEANKEKALKKILEIAKSVVREESEKMTRADLAEELKKEGIKNDSEKVGALVYECYRETGDDDVRKAFSNNQKTRPLVEDATALSILDSGRRDGDGGDFFAFLDERLSDSKVNLETLAAEVSNAMQTVATEAAKLVNIVSGTNALKSIQDEASSVFEKYTRITDTYKSAKDSIDSLASDFSALRDSVGDTYRKRAAELVDIFGDRIKAAIPEVFDFSSIEYLDVDKMKGKIELEYTDFRSKSTELIGGASESFRTKIGQLALLKEDKQAALVLASWNLVSHYMDVANSAALLRSMSLQLKTAVTKDVASIKADQTRLLEIYKTINDILVPKAKVFKKAAEEVFGSEFKSLSEKIYSSPEAKKLKEKRDSLLDELHSLENSIVDGQENISFYESHIKECRTTLSNMKGEYEKAKSSKPEKPGIIKNVITFGSAGKEYDRDISDWSGKCAAVVDTYEDLTVDVELESKDLLDQKKSLDENRRRHTALKREIEEISGKIMAKVAASDEIKRKAAENIEDIVKLLRIAKDIASSSLDESLLKVRTLGDFKASSIRDIDLPSDVKDAVEKFKREYSQILKDGLKQGVKDEVNAEIDSMYTKEDVSEERRNEISEQISEEVLQKSVSLCKLFNQIEKDGEKYALTREHYEKELARLQGEFKENIAKLDDQAQALGEIIRRINLSNGSEELKSSLLELLGDGGSSITKEELDEFLSGKRTLEI